VRVYIKFSDQEIQSRVLFSEFLTRYSRQMSFPSYEKVPFSAHCLAAMAGINDDRNAIVLSVAHGCIGSCKN
jgi:hypothetical protein